MHNMRVGVYIDAFNLYYGSSYLCGVKNRGWRWLCVRSLAQSVLESRRNWAGASISRIVYCTARLHAHDDSLGQIEQDAHLKALRRASSVDRIEYGHYTNRIRIGPLAVGNSRGRPQVVRSGWPVMVQDSLGHSAPEARFLVSTAMREEKGSDVNVATHLLIDLSEKSIDAAMVVTNDSDLRLPIQYARTLVPVGTVNPSHSPTAGALRGDSNDGVGRHWWYRLTAADIFSNQLPTRVGKYTKPPTW